jgi:thioredoxin 1
MMANLLNLTEETFETLVMKSDTIAVVDFYADWCGPCKLVGPIMDNLAVKYAGKVNFYKINIDEQKKLAISHKVMSIPTIFIVKDGEIKEKVTGAVPQSVFEDKIDNILK